MMMFIKRQPPPRPMVREDLYPHPAHRVSVEWTKVTHSGWGGDWTRWEWVITRLPRQMLEQEL